ncbi:MAG: glycosyl transferase, partial [Verrucomicrobiota bacterium]|nr:glycosyl transferase [Verrucomicrobiota bacterium]
MKYGHFDDKQREYIIETPKTPLPWINYLGTEKMFGLISNTAGGYNFYRDARLRRITRYRYNNVPRDLGGRYFYLKENDKIWSPSWQPVKTELDSYKCRHGLGYTIIESEKDKISANLLFFIPIDENIEIRKVSLTNNSKETRSLKLFSFVEFCLWDALDDFTDFQRNLNCAEAEVVGSTIYHTTEYRERRNHYAYYTVNTPCSSIDTDRDAFLGNYNGFDTPDAVINGECSNSMVSGWSPIASHCINIELAPGESKELVFLLGYVENPKEKKFAKSGVINKKTAERQIAQYANTESVNKALNELKTYWDKILLPFQIECEDAKLARMVNIWNPYQCMVTFNLSRSASYFESGIGRGMGFRDSNQDLLGFVHQIPERARERILDIAATQLRDGGAYHQYQPLTKRGNPDAGDNFNDDPQWLILAVGAYIRETGDLAILNEKVPYENIEEFSESLLDHLFRAHNFTLNNLGPHNLPLIGRADWNDCLNLNCFSEEPGESFQTTANKGDGKTAESLMIAGLFMYAAKEFEAMLKTIDKPKDAEKINNAAEEMRKNVNLHGKDKEWFIRAYDAFGKKISSSENDEGKI